MEMQSLSLNLYERVVIRTVDGITRVGQVTAFSGNGETVFVRDICGQHHAVPRARVQRWADVMQEVPHAGRATA